LSDAEPLGDAVLAGLGVGLYKDPVETCERLVRLGKLIEPDMEAHRNYTKLYNVYRKLYVNVKPLFNELMA
jgi:xylulokinase